MPDRTALDVAQQIRAGQSTAVAECEAAIARIEERDGAINAVVIRDFDRARAQAEAVDRRLAAGDTAPLLGVPMTVKESYDVAGLKTSWGFAEHRDHVAKKDAVAVERLKRAGAVILGKTNVPVGLADLQSNSPNYGRTNNPHDHSRTCGGSSGGAAAALASGMVPLEMGSDIGGSIRVPAHFCGVWGHKSTFGMLPTDGHFFPGTDGARAALSVIGPMARDPDDLICALDIVSDLPLPRPEPRDTGDWRILILADHPKAVTSNDTRQVLDDLATAFEQQGTSVARTSDLVPDLEQQHRDYMHMLNIAMTRGQPVGDHPRPTLIEWFDLHDQQARNRRQWHALFENFDAVIAPVLGTNAFPHDETPLADRVLTIDGEQTPFGAQFAFPGLATFPGLPATSVPITRDADGLPIGVQVITDTYQDHQAIAVARLAASLMRS